MPWEEEYCEECGAENWVDLGDLSDLTVSDVEGFKCHKCGHKQMLSNLEEDWECLNDWYCADSFEELLKMINYDNGRAKPGYGE